ncbi:MAG: ATP-binding protein [Hydrogenophaga sp.]|uniref:PAS domain-containing hybrid sensor histidine kinase/response regulator n=1 Tax=Hydrogenophaga sp. TaxID=1904254 RepID=UPI002621CB1C|nr:PAS domain-containing hybrid sensor histidine kinase/response regulator [Hydrogenophaga sp.]MDM7942372.1 ATP-binding protein [Hydrogenophaga sp.]
MKDLNPQSPQRLALDLQRAHNSLKQEKDRTELLLTEVNRLQAELERIQGSARREVNSRLQAEEALNETEERLQFAIEAAGLALWDLRAPFDDVYLTARWGELIGDVALAGSWKSSDLLPRLHPGDAPRVAAELRRLLRGETSRASGEYRFRAHDEWIWLETHAMVAEQDKQGRVIRVMGTHANVTERKLIEEKAEHARALAEQASRAKSEFLANMSHEVRTPLNAIMGLNQLLLGTSLSSEQRQWLQLMDDSSRSLLNLLNDVLDLSRIEAGKLQLERVNFPLRPLLESTVSTYRDQAQTKAVQLTMSLSPQLPAQMSGDPFRIRQVLTNLLSNALKFTPANGKVALMADVGTRGKDSSTLVIRIVDTGIGIAAAQQKEMFDAFTQADASTARQYGGSGLGLAICSKLVKKMGGSIALESSLGSGSTFEVQFPLTKALPGSAISPAKSQLSAAELASMRRRFQKLRVIVAEDNSINELLIRKLLEGVGCEVRLAKDGAEAFRLWEEWAVDLMLMDVQMPIVNGLTATARIREAERKVNRAPTPILAVTANAMAGDREAYMAAGMTGYVTKPIEAPALFSAMAQALETREKPTAAARNSRAAEPAETPGLPATAGARSSALTRKKHLLSSKLSSFQTDVPDSTRRLRVALEQQDTVSAQTELEKLKETFAYLQADRALRISRGLDMARHAGEWGLFARALPLLESEIGTLLARLAVDGGSATEGEGEARKV